MEQVAEIGGVFFRARDPEALVEWYAEHLGWAVDPEGNRFELWEPAAS